jgi:hypothetical protein
MQTGCLPYISRSLNGDQRSQVTADDWPAFVGVSAKAASASSRRLTQQTSFAQRPGNQNLQRAKNRGQQQFFGIPSRRIATKRQVRCWRRGTCAGHMVAMEIRMIGNIPPKTSGPLDRSTARVDLVG